MLEIKEVRKTFGQEEILKKISFSCDIGEIVGVFGRNGSGKSTLLKILHGTVKADSIAMILDGRAINPNDVIPSKYIAYLPQETFLPTSMRVRNLIPLFFPLGDNQDKIFYSKGVSEFENRKVGELSLGQLRYLEILLIGNLEHPYLMLDEPFSMIEPIFKEIIKEFLLGLKEEKGILVTDHYYEDVLQITNTNFIINNGENSWVRDKSDLMEFGYLRTYDI